MGEHYGPGPGESPDVVPRGRFYGRPMSTRTLVVTIGAVAFAAAVPAQAGGGCPASRCIPLTGTWTAPSPQKLPNDPILGKSSVVMHVVYLGPNGSPKRSKYGNAFTVNAILLRWRCPPNSDGIDYTDGGVGVYPAHRINSHGIAAFTTPSTGSIGVHHWRVHFRRKTVTASVSGTARAGPTGGDGPICKASVTFFARFKRAS